MENRDYAKVLNEIAMLQRIAGDNHFKVRAFERAAKLVEDLARPLDELLDEHSAEELQGIGESIETELQALRTTGESPRHQELLSRLGAGVFDLLEVKGLGMRRLQVLFQELGITSVPALKQAAEDGKLRELPSFGKAIETQLLSEIEHFERTRGKRWPLPEAKGLADSIRLQMLDLPEVDRCEVAGSIRRGRETIGDVDLLVTTQNPHAVAAWFKAMPEVTEVIADGVGRASVRVTGGVQVDMRVLEPEVFGAGLHYFTGSKEHHIQMRLRSKKLGLKISERGVYRSDDPDEVPVGPMETEEQVFAAVGLPYIPPEIRMGTDEIELAELDSLPRLVDLNDLRGDVHVRSDLSGGSDTLESLAAAAAARGYEWLVVAQRSAGADPARGLDDAGLREWLEEAPEEVGGVRLLRGVETTVLPDGLLDVDHRILARADWVVAVYDHDLGGDADSITQAIVWAIETGVVSCLGTPTGRHLGVHEGIPLYFDEVVEACLDFGVALEINGHPSRLDLNGQLAARVRERGAMLALGSAAGSAAAFDNIEYAVQQAKRGWLEPRDVLNSLPADALLERVRRLV